MIFTTTNNIENHTIIEYFGVVSGIELKNYTVESFKNMFSAEKKNETFKSRIEEAKEEVLQQMKSHAIKFGANAIVGIHIDVEITSQHYKTVVSGTGTAVKVQ